MAPIPIPSFETANEYNKVEELKKATLNSHSSPYSPIAADPNILHHRHYSSSDALRCLHPSGSGSGSGGPDSPYSRLSRNLSQLLDEVDAEDDAKLLSRIASRATGNDSAYRNIYESIKTLVISIGDNCTDTEFDEVLGLVATCGTIVAHSRPSRGSLIVEFAGADDSQHAQSILAGHNLHSSGRLMYARSQAKPDQFFAYKASRVPSLSSRCICIRIFNLTDILGVGHVGSEVTDDMLRRVFEAHGPVESVRRVEGRGCAFVNYRQVEHAVIARKALNNSRLGNGIIKTGFAKVSLYDHSNDSPPPAAPQIPTIVVWTLQI
jgi:RNA recognition motif